MKHRVHRESLKQA